MAVPAFGPDRLEKGVEDRFFGGLGRLAAATGARATAERSLDLATSVFKTLGAQHDLDEAAEVRRRIVALPPPQAALTAFEVDEGIVRRLVDAAIFPELLSREMATALLDTTEVDSVVVFVQDELHLPGSLGKPERLDEEGRRIIRQWRETDIGAQHGCFLRPVGGV